MRLNAYLARAGVASRRKADELIKDGRVSVNGEPGQLNTFVAAGDDVRLDGGPLGETRGGRAGATGGRGQLNPSVPGGDAAGLEGEPLAKQRLAYVLLHKPRGVVT